MTMIPKHSNERNLLILGKVTSLYFPNRKKNTSNNNKVLSDTQQQKKKGDRSTYKNSSGPLHSI